LVQSINRLIAKSQRQDCDNFVTTLKGRGSSHRVSVEKSVLFMSQKFRVLFLCSSNADRSIFAEHFLRSLGSDRFEVYSAGEQPTREVHPLVAKVLRENFKIDASDAVNRSWRDLAEKNFDFVITVCDDMRERTPVLPGTPITAHWSIPDPLALGGSDEEVYQRLLQTAFQVRRRVELFNSLPIEKLDNLQREV
jgi:arsenate reductase (thioredoxin)